MSDLVKRLREVDAVFGQAATTGTLLSYRGVSLTVMDLREAADRIEKYEAFVGKVREVRANAISYTAGRAIDQALAELDK